jgi:hypothetical protein
MTDSSDQLEANEYDRPIENLSRLVELFKTKDAADSLDGYERCWLAPKEVEVLIQNNISPSSIWFDSAGWKKSRKDILSVEFEHEGCKFYRPYAVERYFRPELQSRVTPFQMWRILKEENQVVNT